jgi:hypothetical protein
MITLPARSGTSSTLNVDLGGKNDSRMIARMDPITYVFRELLEDWEEFSVEHVAWESYVFYLVTKEWMPSYYLCIRT